MVRRYGAPVLLLSWAPILGDALVAVAGGIEMPFWRFVGWVVAGKAAGGHDTFAEAAAAMALTSSDLDALDLAIASGKLAVRLGDRMVTYHSLSDLLKARDHVAKILAAGPVRTAPCSPRPRG